MSSSFSLRAAVRGTSRTVWLITGVWAGLLALWSVIPPIFVAADEPQHIDMVVATTAVGPLEWFGINGRIMDPRIGTIERQLAYFDEESLTDPAQPVERRVEARAENEAPPRDERLSFAGFDGLPSPLLNRRNQMTQHPPVYYRLLGGALALWPGWEDARFDLVVAVLRILSAMFVLPLPLLASWTARGLGSDPATQTVTAAAVLVIPQTAHLGSVVTNDSLLIGLGGGVIMLAAHVGTGDTSRRTAVRLGMLTALAILTKALGLVLPIVIAAAYAAAWLRMPRERRRRIGRSGLTAAAIATAVLAISGWWFVENVVRYGAVQPAVLSPSEPAVRGGVVEFFTAAVPVQLTTFWGRFGWAEVGFGTTVAVLCTVVFVGLIAAGMWRRPALQAVVLLGPSVIAVAIVWVQAYGYFGGSGTLRAVAGRYAAVGLLGLTTMAALGLVRVVSARRAVVVVLVAAGILHLGGLALAIRYFWGSETSGGLVGSVADSVRAMLAWGAWPPRLVQSVAVAVVGAVVWLIVEVSRTSATTGSSDGAAGQDERDDSAEQDQQVTA